MYIHQRRLNHITSTKKSDNENFNKVESLTKFQALPTVLFFIFFIIATYLNLPEV